MRLESSINHSQSQDQGILSRGLSQGQVQNQTQVLYVVCLFKPTTLQFRSGSQVAKALRGN